MVKDFACMDGLEEKFLMFVLGKELYGIPILKVSEIIGLLEITPIPKTPEYFKGIINLRGKIIPVIDLRLKFGMEPKEYDEQTCTIIVNVPISGKDFLIGIVVDMVSEVINVMAGDIELPPNYGKETDTDFLTGIAKVKEKVVMLLDIEKIINGSEAAVIMDRAE